VSKVAWMGLLGAR